MGPRKRGKDAAPKKKAEVAPSAEGGGGKKRRGRSSKVEEALPKAQDAGSEKPLTAAQRRKMEKDAAKPSSLVQHLSLSF